MVVLVYNSSNCETEAGEKSQVSPVGLYGKTSLSEVFSTLSFPAYVKFAHRLELIIGADFLLFIYF